ncbi:IS110 family transposase [Pseudonocardia yunnanensis]
MAGIAALHAVVADHLTEDGEPDQVMVGIETDRRPWVQALLCAGYLVYAVIRSKRPATANDTAPRARRATPGMRTYWPSWCDWTGAHHRPVAGDSAIAKHVKVVAKAHQSMVWSRQHQSNTLRSMLREYYPGALTVFGSDLAGRDALAVLALAPTPAKAARLTEHQIAAALHRAGRQRNITTRADEIVAGLRAQQLPARPGVVDAYAAAAQALSAVITELARQTTILQSEVEAGFGRHPDVEIYLSQPGLGRILGARVLAEFGDDPHRYLDAKARKNYSGMAPITKASGKSRAVLARHARNRRLADALYQQAFAALTSSPGARTYYDTHRARGNAHHQALRTLANRLVGILHGCLRHHTPYNETLAWAAHTNPTATAA